MRPFHIISLAIERPCTEVYAYLSQPQNYGEWAAVQASSFKPLPNGDWEGQMLFGYRHVRFTPRNAYGVLDHAVFVPGGEVLFTPMRVVPNDDVTLLSFTFFAREGMDETQFASAVEWITSDFLALKTLLEARG